MAALGHLVRAGDAQLHADLAGHAPARETPADRGDRDQVPDEHVVGGYPVDEGLTWGEQRS